MGALKRGAGTPLRITFILILDRCFFDGFEQNKMNKGAIICLNHYVSFYFKFVCFPWWCEWNFPLMNVKMKLDSKRFKRKSLVLIFWNFPVLCTNLKSCAFAWNSKHNLMHSNSSVGCRVFLTHHGCALTHSEPSWPIIYIKTTTQRHLACDIVNR